MYIYIYKLNIRTCWNRLGMNGDLMQHVTYKLWNRHFKIFHVSDGMLLLGLDAMDHFLQDLIRTVWGAASSNNIK